MFSPQPGIWRTSLVLGQGQGCAYHALPAVCQMSNGFALIQSTEALGLCGTLRMAPGHIFLHRATQEVSHCSALHTWCDHALSPLCLTEAKVGVLKTQRNMQSAAGMCRAWTAGINEKLGSQKLFPGRSHFHVCLLLIRPNLCLVAQISEMASTLEWLTGIHHTGSQAKQSGIPLWTSFLILAGLLALLL